VLPLLLLLPPRAVRLPMELTGPGSSPAPAAAAVVVRLSAAAVVADACPAALPAHVLPGAGLQEQLVLLQQQQQQQQLLLTGLSPLHLGLLLLLLCVPRPR
jgi:hypothetical protein